jgi:hypothetical protein
MTRRQACAVSIAVALSLLLVSCAPPSAEPALTIENRGGPAFAVRIGPVEVTRVECDDGATISPGHDGVPPLPWDLTVVRLADGSVVLRSTLTELPSWLVQIGDEIAVGTSPVAGPPGPSCPVGADQ